MNGDFTSYGNYHRRQRIAAEREATEQPLPQLRGASLADQVAELREGDKVRASFRIEGDSRTYQVVADLRRSPVDSDILHLVGEGSIVRSAEAEPGPRLVSVELLDRAPVAFYTNQPADRQPRIGDVAMKGEGRLPKLGDVAPGRFVFDGRRWFRDATFEAQFPNHYDMPAGFLALVDPSEMGGA